MKLETIRKKLDKIDNQIMKALSIRQSYMPAVAKYKKDNNLPLNQPKRENAILESKKEMAKNLNLNTEMVEKIFKLIFKNSKDIQKNSI